MRFVGFEEISGRSVARLRGAADEGDALAVQRPYRIGVGVDTRSDEAHGFARHVIDADEAVIPASGYENKLRAVGRPILGMILPADDKLLWLLARVERSKVDLAVAHVSDDTLYRNLGGIANVHL